MKKFKVRITKKGGWYVNRIGETFIVVSNNISHFRVVNMKDVYIHKFNCEIIEENVEIKEELSKINDN